STSRHWVVIAVMNVSESSFFRAIVANVGTDGDSNFTVGASGAEVKTASFGINFGKKTEFSTPFAEERRQMDSLKNAYAN
ncbi:35836_t:CDS:2, partial [Gigaspora margarita]